MTTCPSVLSFFSGIMGLDLGLESAGFKILLTCEIDKFARQTIAANRPQLPILGDIRDYSAASIRSAAGLTAGFDIDLVVGGPPCQAFSTAGRRKGFEDARGNVFLTYIDLILELRPRFFVIENVRGLLSAPLRHRPHSQRKVNQAPLAPDEQPGGALAHILKVLQEGGYGVSFNLYNAANFGTPQIRERVIILGSRDGLTLPFLSPTHAENGAFGLKPWVTFREAVKGLPSYPATYIAFPERRLKFFRMLKAGQNWRFLPADVQAEAMGRSLLSGGGRTGFFRRLSWDKPSPTLVTHPAMPATDLCHPLEDRPLSVEEYKRLQQFPDHWIIAGSIKDQYRLLGNAVPCGLGKAIGLTIRDAMESRVSRSPKDFKYSRYQNTSHITWTSKHFSFE